MFRSRTQKNYIKISVIHSHVGGKAFWKDLDKNWKKYGDIKLKVSIKLLKKEITMKRLTKEKPDIIIFSDTAGSPSSFSSEEINVLENYFKHNGCKHLLGTYALFQHLEQRTNDYDNRKICHFFGIDEKLKFSTINLENAVCFRPESEDKSILWKHIELPFVSDGYCHSQVPTTLNWFTKNGEFIGGNKPTVIARNEQGTAVVSYYSTKTYSSLYISTMPEFNTLETKADSQFIYNCCLFLMNTNPILSLQSLCIKKLRQSQQKIQASDIPPQLFPCIQELISKRRKLKRKLTISSQS